MVTSVRGLIDLHKWDPSTEGQGQYGYDAVMSAGPEILPSLVAHLTDETPTMLYDQPSDRRVKLGDVCYYLLLRLTGLKQEEFLQDGVFISTALPNPIFCIRWTEPTLQSRRRVQLHFQKILPPPEDQ
jgi:hypothetical protein